MFLASFKDIFTCNCYLVPFFLMSKKTYHLPLAIHVKFSRLFTVLDPVFHVRNLPSQATVVDYLRVLIIKPLRQKKVFLTGLGKHLACRLSRAGRCRIEQLKNVGKLDYQLEPFKFKISIKMCKLPLLQY